MFKTPIDLIPPFTNNFITQHAAVRNELNTDRTLFMTLILLLYNRVENLALESTITRGQSIESVPYNTNPNVYSFHWVETDSNPDETLKQIKNFKEIVPEPMIEKYLKEKFGQTIYIRKFPEENAVAFYTNHITIDMWHLLQSFTSRYFKIFDEKPITNEEKEFARTLILRTPNEYTRQIQILTEAEEFKTYCLKKMLNSFEKSIFTRKIQTAKNEVATLESKMDNYLSQYRALVQQHFTAKIFLEGLMSASSGVEEKTELQEYLINNKNLANVSVTDSHIHFVVKTYLIPYLTESWENMDNRGAIYSNFSDIAGELGERDNLRLLFNAIFSSSHCLKLRICAHIDLDYLGSSVQSNRSYDYSKFPDYIPNAHLQKHNCFGQNGPDIIEQLKMGDPIGAIECAINCVKHINVDELNATFIPFLKNLLRCTGKCIVTEDNQELTPLEAINYLKEKKNENNPFG